MQNRREFVRSAAMLTAGAFAWGTLPEAIARAVAIDPAPNTTFRDAEHVVILMQENRSFDHCFGALRGVRGFRDPRPHVQPDGNPVWFQTDARGDTYAPFRLDITGTNATWIGGLPHTWPDQVDARNGGRYDKWLIAKPKQHLPFTLGHYTRADIPFYYALADAFTVCDQAFCSSLTGTTANRLFHFTGAIRANVADTARVLNAETYYDREVSWPTFPEALENAGISWRIYQNEITLDSGLSKDEDAWLSSFGDNPLEWFSQYHVRFAKSRRTHLEQQSAEPRGEGERAEYTTEAWRALSPAERALHEKAFTTNEGDPGYRSVTKLSYQDGDSVREVSVPSGDVLHQFRRDVESGGLPEVSWLIAPQNFSDHPSAPWYGAWYVSETLNILTKNPEVWKKTVFILCYDENDGYFDHVPPFVAPHPTRAETGRASAGMDTAPDWANVHGRDSAIGLGYRVPLVVVSPWSRGGCVNSQVLDHTSVMRFLEVWLAGKGKTVRAQPISDWRRTICGDLTSAFRPYGGEPIDVPRPLDRDATVERIHAAKFRSEPHGGGALTELEVAATNVGALQEPGTRPSCPLPYELMVNAEANGSELRLLMEARAEVPGTQLRGVGAPFNAYSYGAEMLCRAYAVRAGDTLRDNLPVATTYHVRVDGPNGFMRQFVGEAANPVMVVVDRAIGRGHRGAMEIGLSNRSATARDVTIKDESYGAPDRHVTLRGRSRLSVVVDVSATHGWYDFTVSTARMAYRYAGRLESGEWSITDPAMGRA